MEEKCKVWRFVYLYSLISDYQIMEDEMGEGCSMHGGVTNECDIFRL